MSAGMIVFDMDGVLVEVTESYRESICRTVEHFTGQSITRESIQEYKNRGGWNNDWLLSQKICADLGTAVAYDTVVSWFQSIFFGSDGQPGLVERETWIARPGLLEGLAERYRMSIFTGRLRSEAAVTLNRFARHLRFDPIVADDDVSRPKPAPEGLLKIAALCAGEPIWYIGDTVDDARSARAAGLPFVGIAARSNPKHAELVELLRGQNAIAILDDINALPEVLA